MREVNMDAPPATASPMMEMLKQIDEAKLKPIEDAAFAKGLLLQPTLANGGQLCWFVFDQYRLDNLKVVAPMFACNLDVVAELVEEYST